MLLAVEGGRFISSSASGYIKGLAVVYLGKKPEKKPMRVAPWNQYQLVDQETNPDLHLASRKNRLVRGCASFLCFGRAAAGLESPSSLKVEPTHRPQDVLKSFHDLDKVKEKVCNSDLVDDDDNNINACSLRSSLKKPATMVSAPVAVYNESEGKNVHGVERRVQWTDVVGGELFLIREFEPSEHSGSDDEFGNRNERSCLCKLL